MSECISRMLEMQACVLLATACFSTWLRRLPVHCILAMTVIFQSSMEQTVILAVVIGVANMPVNHKHGAESKPQITGISQRGKEAERTSVISHTSRQG